MPSKERCAFPRTVAPRHGGPGWRQARGSRISGTERVVRCPNRVADSRPSGNSSPAFSMSAMWTGCRSQMERPVTVERSRASVAPPMKAITVPRCRASSRNRGRFEIGSQACGSWSSALASFRSSVSKPSVNQPWTEARDFARLLAITLIAPAAFHTDNQRLAASSHSPSVRPCQGSGPGSRPAATSASRPR